ncbi:hypothetical protein J2Z62_000079 [Mycoplasmoides fastidiosum]|uniref:Uncharacterized protein n=1 Tax=Mycoplasmoides fastidiosum TaxID=92758 RepID=A0ABU0LY53_9BACT|nr:hypothetical protein [Mycoplasmoides fastidiosum]MDQ0513641.1 hypothetical protein [Mycoplasmoides fastidiosum]
MRSILVSVKWALLPSNCIDKSYINNFSVVVVFPNEVVVALVNWLAVVAIK